MFTEWTCACCFYMQTSSVSAAAPADADATAAAVTSAAVTSAVAHSAHAILARVRKLQRASAQEQKAFWRGHFAAADADSNTVLDTEEAKVAVAQIVGDIFRCGESWQPSQRKLDAAFSKCERAFHSQTLETRRPTCVNCLFLYLACLHHSSRKMVVSLQRYSFLYFTSSPRLQHALQVFVRKTATKPTAPSSTQADAAAAPPLDQGERDASLSAICFPSLRGSRSLRGGASLRRWCSSSLFCFCTPGRRQRCHLARRTSKSL